MSDLDPQLPETREGSYYELALTNRQVFVAVVLFLASLSGAFLGGIWFVRDASPQGAGEAVAPSASTAAKPSPEGLDEYRFFSENHAAGKPAAGSLSSSPTPAPVVPSPSSAQRPDPSTTLAEDVGAQPAPAPAKPAPPPTKPVPTAAGTDLWVQVFSSADVAQARRVVEQLKKAGYRGALSPAPGNGSSPLQRVRIGPFKDRGQAQRVADDVRRKLKFSTWITSTQ